MNLALDPLHQYKMLPQFATSSCLTSLVVNIMEITFAVYPL